MQYSTTLGRQELETLAVNSLLGSLSRGDVQEAAACLHDNAHFCVQTRFMTASGKDAIIQAFERYVAKVGPTPLADVKPVIDEKNGRVAVSFTLSIDRINEVQANTLFCRIRDDKIQDLYLYVSGENLFA